MRARGGAGRAAAAWAVAALAWATSAGLARADALPPTPPITCARGSHVRTDHGGTRCELDAPKDCPVGWLGEAGGACVLDVCSTTCAAGKTCKPVDLCGTDAELWGSRAPAPRGPELAAPPIPRKGTLFTVPCGPGRTCAGDATCRAAGVCLPAGADMPGAPPANGAAAKTFGYAGPPPGAAPPGTVAPPPPSATASPASTETAPVTNERRVPGKSGGCAGCATTARGASSAEAIGLALLALVALRRRR